MTASQGNGVPGGVDARRYVWCWSQVVWSFGPVLPMLREDVDGAEESEQTALLQLVCRQVVENCAIAVYLVETYQRPLPPESIRAAVACSAVRDPLLRSLLSDLLCCAEDNPAVLAELCRRTIDRTLQIIGEVPDLISKTERMKALGAARDWLSLIDSVGEGKGDWLPRLPEKTPGSGK